MKAASGAIRNYDIYTKKMREPFLQDAILVKSYQSSPILSLSQEKVIINSSRSEITKNFNLFHFNVNIQ